MRACFLSDIWNVDPMTGAPVITPSAYYRLLHPMQIAADRNSALGMPAWDGSRGFGVKVAPNRANFQFDVVAMKNLMHRWIPYQIEASRAMGQFVINDVDDLYDAIEPTNRAHADTDPERDKVTNREHYREAVMGSDRIVVSTPALAAHYRELGHRDVVIVRNSIVPAMFQRRPVSRGRRPVIGWVGALEWRSDDFAELRSWLPDFLEDHDLTFHHSGRTASGGNVGEALGIPEHRFTSSPALSFNYIGMLYNEFDIGLVPLTDVPFNRAKSFLKGLEYAAAGVPFVASALPEYQLLADTGVGRVARTPEEWASHCETLLDWRERRLDEARNYTALMDQHTIEKRAPDWRDAYLMPAPVTSGQIGG